MKIPRSSPRNRLLSHLRIATVVTLMSAAAATAFVAVKPSGPVFLAKAENKGGIDKLRQNRAELFRSKMTLPGPEREGGPVSAAEEDYAKRAFPATDIPIALRRNAHAAWASVRGRSGREAANALGAWTLAGPSTSNAPDILTFSGAAYTTSGRITALAVDPSCNTRRCRVWAAAAGGGVWRTTNALAGSRADWTFVSGSFATNAIGTLTYDAATGALYAGTGEPNASGDSEAGFGIYKSTDGGNTWTHLAANTTVPVMATPCGDAPAYTGPAFDGRATSSIVVRGNTMYVGSTRAVRGVSSVTGGGVTLAPGLPPYGLWKSTDGGATFALLAPEGVCLNPALPGDAGKIQASFGSARGVNDVEFDPNYATNTTLYAAAFPRLTASGGGVWRSNDDGANWTQIKTALAPNNINDRAEFAVTLLGSGTTRMYVGDGNTGSPAARFYRSDDFATGSPTFTDLTTTQNEDYCTGQCWYDNVVYSPPGKPDVVYLGGSYSYGSYGFTTNGRAFIRSADAGASFTDMTWDATTNPTPPGSCCQPNPVAPNGQHPDSHAIVEIPGTNSAIFGGDGGLMRSSGAFADISGQCTTYRGLTGGDLILCQQMLSAVPTYLYNLNKRLSTIQFQSVSVAADNYKHLQGGTQDNGTFETYGSFVTWPQEIYGDGGQSGFSVTNSSMRFNSFFGQNHDANFRNADPLKWVIISAPIAGSSEGSNFYAPIIADPNPANAGTIFEGSQSVWRTQDWGGDQATLEANCPEFTTSGTQPGCGDFVQIGPAGDTDLTVTTNGGTTRAGGFVAAIARTASDTGTMWVATTTGRVFISTNADAAAGSVTYTRLDTLPSATADPGRVVSGIFVDPANSNHAWISYSGYNFNTLSQPGHVFEVTYNPGTPDATWTSLDNPFATPFPVFPATGIARDSNGDLYVSNDFGVMVLSNGSTSWATAGSGLPMVEVAGLTIVPGSRVLYAATHGRSAWKLTLP